MVEACGEDGDGGGGGEMKVVVVAMFGVLGFLAGVFLRPGGAPSVSIRTVEELISDLRSGELGRRVEAVEQLRTITGLRFGYNPYGRREERESGWRKWRKWWEQARGKSPQEWLAEALLDKGYPFRADAALRIAARGYRGCVEALIKALSDEDGRVRAAAAEALGQLRDERAITPLSSLLGDGDASVAGAAALALARFGEKGAVAINQNIHLISHPTALQSAADALLANNLSATEPLKRLLRGDTHSKLFAIDRIRRCRITALKDEVAALVSDPDPAVKKAAKRLLSALGDGR